jgi:stage II sporulation protein D
VPKQPQAVGILSRSILRLVAFVMAALLYFAVPASILAEPSFTFRARGNGHGVGMSQYGARGFAMQGYSHEQILRHYYRGTELGTLPGSQTMRVALQRTDVPAPSWTFSTHSAPMRVDWSSRGEASYLGLDVGVPYRFSTSGSSSSITITNVLTGAVVRTLTNATWVNLFEFDTSKPHSTGLTRVHDASGPQSWNNVIYQGWIRLDRGAGANADRIHLRNLVQMEDYVKCVVPREMPPSWSSEALKAQAVAARSYAHVSKLASAPFDVSCTTASQVYNGWGRWVDGRAKRHNETDPGVGGDWLSDPMVDATRGRVVTYDGIPVRTYFFSTSGGYTENSENIWSAALPYATGVPDPYEYLAGASAHTLPEIELTASQVRARLLARGFTSAELPASISGIRVLERGVSGRVMRLQLLGAAGDHTMVEKAKIPAFRTAISEGTWNTTWFYANPKTTRIEGATRYSTSVEASRRAFSRADQVVLVGGHAAADALSAAAFASSLPNGAPILLTESARLTPSVKSEIERLGASKIYIIGGELAVGPMVENTLLTIPALEGPGSIERIGGVNRYDTARLLANRVLATVPGSRVFVVNGSSLADALAISPVAYSRCIPIVPVRVDSIPPESAAVLNRSDVALALVVGGDAAISSSVYWQLPTAQRVAAGENRYDTAGRIATWAVTNENFRMTSTYIASGTSLVDALAAAPLIGGWRHTVLFSKRDSLPSATRSALAGWRHEVESVHMLGGEGALGNGVEASIERVLE